MVSASQISTYQASRDPGTDRSVLCHAPFTTLYFGLDGKVSACCYRRNFVLGRYPEQSLSELWEGLEATELREDFLEAREARGCERCFHQLASGDIENALMRDFDSLSTTPGYTARARGGRLLALDLELANTCNLECIMCTEVFSSAIQRRKGLPPIPKRYDGAFVDQLRPYLADLRKIRLYGGEPFMIRWTYELFEAAREANPDLVFSITTNGTLLPDRARRLLEDLNVGIVLSLDAITPSVYEAIRKNARFDVVERHLQWFRAYAARRGTSFSIVACPMVANWRDLPKLVRFCLAEDIPLGFNVVLNPSDQTLSALPPETLDEVLRHWSGLPETADSQNGASTLESWRGHIEQVHAWREAKRDRRQRARRALGAAEDSVGPGALQMLEVFEARREVASGYVTRMVEAGNLHHDVWTGAFERRHLPADPREAAVALVSALGAETGAPAMQVQERAGAVQASGWRLGGRNRDIAWACQNAASFLAFVDRLIDARRLDRAAVATRWLVDQGRSQAELRVTAREYEQRLRRLLPFDALTVEPASAAESGAGVVDALLIAAAQLEPEADLDELRRRIETAVDRLPGGAAAPLLEEIDIEVLGAIVLDPSQDRDAPGRLAASDGPGVRARGEALRSGLTWLRSAGRTTAEVERTVALLRGIVGRFLPVDLALLAAAPQTELPQAVDRVEPGDLPAALDAVMLGILIIAPEGRSPSDLRGIVEARTAQARESGFDLTDVFSNLSLDHLHAALDG